MATLTPQSIEKLNGRQTTNALRSRNLPSSGTLTVKRRRLLIDITSEAKDAAPQQQGEIPNQQREQHNTSPQLQAQLDAANLMIAELRAAPSSNLPIAQPHAQLPIDLDLQALPPPPNPPPVDLQANAIHVPAPSNPPPVDLQANAIHVPAPSNPPPVALQANPAHVPAPSIPPPADLHANPAPAPPNPVVENQVAKVTANYIHDEITPGNDYPVKYVPLDDCVYRWQFTGLVIDEQFNRPYQAQIKALKSYGGRPANPDGVQGVVGSGQPKTVGFRKFYKNKVSI